MASDESFAELFEESLKTLNLQAGSTTTGVIVDIDHKARFATVRTGDDSEARIPLDDFSEDASDLSTKVGDEVQLSLNSDGAVDVQ